MQLLHYTSLAVSLLPCFEGLAVAAPLQTYRSDSYAIHPQTTNSPSPGKLISSWKVTSVLQLWDTKKDDHETIPKHHNIHDQHLEITTTITPSPCHHKGPLQCSSSTPNPAAYKYRYKFRAPAVRFPSLSSLSSSSSSSSSETDSSRSPSSQSLFHSKNDIERILAPVGILVIMVWLGFVAVVLVAAIDYVWMRWGRGFTGYETITTTTTTTAEGVGLGIIEEGRGDGSGGVKSGLSDIPEDDEQVEEHGMV